MEHLRSAVGLYSGDRRSLRATIAELEALRPELAAVSSELVDAFDHHMTVLEEIFALTLQTRWSPFGLRKRQIVRRHLSALRELADTHDATSTGAP
jgi:hypothetical protein